MLNLSLSSYYYKSKEQALSEAKEENDLQDHIERIALEYPRYGYRRITHQLKREGVTVNHKRVLRIMRESSLLVVAKRKWVKTTDSNHRYPIYSNLIKDSILTGMNQIWIADITYIRVLLGFVYLAVILDAFSRKALGYCICRVGEWVTPPTPHRTDRADFQQSALLRRCPLTGSNSGRFA